MMKRLILLMSVLTLGLTGFACTADDALSDCSPGQKKCADSRVVSCMDNGTWDKGIACVAPNALCDASTYTCVAEVTKCKKGEKVCNGNTLLSCKEDGSWDSGVECMGNTPRCDAQLKRCIAIDKVCSKDERKCAGNVLHVCQIDGTWGVGVECSDATPICDAKLKQCVKDDVEVCKKDEKKCAGNMLHVCQADGKWNAGVECSGATPICDANKLQCVQADVCKVEEDCEDLATTCIDTACLKIGLKTLSGPDAVQVDTEVDFVLTLNAKVRKTDGINVKITADKKDVSINGVPQTTELIVAKGQEQVILKVKVKSEAGSLSRSYTLSAVYDGVTLDAHFNVNPTTSKCVGNMIAIDDKEPINCPNNQVCVKDVCVDFALISMVPAKGEVLSYDKDYVFMVTANAPARKDMQITPSGVGITTHMKSFSMIKGDQKVYFIAHVSALAVSDKDVNMTLKYNDNMDVEREFTQSYDLVKCKDDETKCNGMGGVLICHQGKWDIENPCPKGHVCLPLTQTCGWNTLLSMSPHFALIRAKEAHTLTLRIQTEAGAPVSLYIKTSSADLSCEKALVPSGEQFATVVCKVEDKAVLGQLIMIDVYDNEYFNEKSLATAMVWLSFNALGLD